MLDKRARLIMSVLIYPKGVWWFRELWASRVLPSQNHCFCRPCFGHDVQSCWMSGNGIMVVFQGLSFGLWREIFSIPTQFGQLHASNYLGTVRGSPFFGSSMSVRQCTKPDPKRHSWVVGMICLWARSSFPKSAPLLTLYENNSRHWKITWISL